MPGKPQRRECTACGTIIEIGDDGCFRYTFAADVSVWGSEGDMSSSPPESVLGKEMDAGLEKYGPFMSMDDGWSRTQREIDELRVAAHKYRPLLERNPIIDDLNRKRLKDIRDESLQVAAMAMRLRELSIAYIDKLDDDE